MGSAQSDGSDNLKTASKRSVASGSSVGSCLSEADGDEVYTVDVECILFREQTRSEFTVVASEFCELCVIDKMKFWGLRKDDPLIEEHLKEWVGAVDHLVQKEKNADPNAMEASTQQEASFRSMVRPSEAGFGHGGDKSQGISDSA